MEEHADDGYIVNDEKERRRDGKETAGDDHQDGQREHGTEFTSGLAKMVEEEIGFPHLVSQLCLLRETLNDFFDGPIGLQ